MRKSALPRCLVNGVLAMTVNLYLLLAFAAVWLIFMLYAWSLSRRQARLQRDLEELKTKLRDQPPAPPGA